MTNRANADSTGADGKIYHSHDGLAPHTHEPLESPGFFSRRAQPISTRNFKERAFTVGIGGPVGTGYAYFSDQSLKHVLTDLELF